MYPILRPAALVEHGCRAAEHGLTTSEQYCDEINEGTKTLADSQDIHSRLISPCCTLNNAGELAEADVGAVIRNLLLFDVFILDARKLLEFPALISAFGVDGLIELLRSGRLKVNTQAASVGQAGQTAGVLRQQRDGLPLKSYSFVAIEHSDQQQYMHIVFKNLGSADARLKDIIKLKRAILDAMIPWRKFVCLGAVEQLEADLRANAPIVQKTVAHVIRRDFGAGEAAKELRLQVEVRAQADFAIESNLNTLGFDESAEHRMIERGLIGLGTLYQRIDEMRVHSTVSGFIEPDSPLFTERLGFLLREASPDTQFRDFARVVEISGVPEFIPSIDRINIPRLLEILGSDECREFRRWLRGIRSAADSEIIDRVKSLRSRIGSALQTRTAKTLRFITSTGMGFIPGANVSVGIAAGAIDAFLIDRVLPSSGVWTFINRMYPSIFETKQ